MAPERVPRFAAVAAIARFRWLGIRGLGWFLAMVSNGV
jgi:hypothetical protein